MSIFDFKVLYYCCQIICISNYENLCIFIYRLHPLNFDTNRSQLRDLYYNDTSTIPQPQ
jgi:hypothetical protein